MGTYTPDNLLDLASLFEARACRKLGFLLVADEVSPEVQQFKNTDLAYAILALTGAFPTTQEWALWLEANRTVLSLVPRNWWRSAFSGKLQASEDEHGRDVFISEQPTTPETVELKASHILKGIGSIPNIYVMVGVRKRNAPFILPPQFAHDAWVLEMFKRFFSIGLFSDTENTSADLQIIAKFLEDNKDIIRKIRSSFQKSEPQFLGGGADGTAFDIGGGRVLKFFKDNSAFRKSVLAVERLHKSPEIAKTEAMIYDIGKFAPFTDRYGAHDLYYYIIEKMTPIEDFPDVAQYTNDIRWHVTNNLGLSKTNTQWKAQRDKVKDPTQHAALKREVEAMAKNISETMKQDTYSSDPSIPSFAAKIKQIESDIPNLAQNWLEEFVEEVIMKFLTYRTDLHSGNLGVTVYGKLRYFDPAYSHDRSSFV